MLVRSTRMNLSSNRQKLLSGAVTFGVQAGLLGLLLYGLAVDRTVKPSSDTQLVDITTAPPPPEVKIEPVKPERSHKAKEKPAPPNLRAHPTEIAPPPPVVKMPVIPPVVVAPIASNGASSRAGASSQAGPGTGAGGNGNGLGGGGDGDGGPEQIAGALSASDLPKSLVPKDFQGRLDVDYEVTVRYVITERGRVEQCETQRTSGHADLDTLTCALIEKRFRYRPATDGQGRPVAVHMVNEVFHWGVNEEDEERRQASNDDRRHRLRDR